MPLRACRCKSCRWHYSGLCYGRRLVLLGQSTGSSPQGPLCSLTTTSRRRVNGRGASAVVNTTATGAQVGNVPEENGNVVKPETGKGWCEPCSASGYLCQIETHNVTGCPPTCQMDRLDDECPYCKGTGQWSGYDPELVAKRCKHPRLKFRCSGFFIQCLNCSATWQPYAMKLSHRLRCESGASGTRKEPSPLVQLAEVALD